MLGSLYLRDVLRLVSFQIDVALSYPRTGSGPTTRPGLLSCGTRLPLPPESSCLTHSSGCSSFKDHHHLVVMTN
jgi:hypothetical protein